MDVDGTYIGKGAVFGLSVSDILPGDMMADRLTALADMADGLRHMGLVCVRNDSMDPGIFSAAAVAASSLGLGLVLESPDPVCLRTAVQSLPGRRPLMTSTDPGSLAESCLLSTVTGCPVCVRGRGTQEVLDAAETAESYGAEDIVIDPMPGNMKQCLEICTDIRRLSAEHGIPQASHPMMIRTWSGEYALAVSSVGVMRGADIVILDDLDPDGCRVLDGLIDAFSHRILL